MASDGRLAIYPGTFDPVHLGHVDVARRAASLFDRVVVAVVRDRPSKPLLFTVAERVVLFQEALSDLANVTVESYEGLTVRYAERGEAHCVVRGLRGAIDFEYEYHMTSMNRHLAPAVDAVFLMTPPQHLYLSSSLIKEVAAQGGSMEGLVSAHVARALQMKLGGTG